MTKPRKLLLAQRAGALMEKVDWAYDECGKVSIYFHGLMKKTFPGKRYSIEHRGSFVTISVDGVQGTGTTLFEALNMIPRKTEILRTKCN